MDNEKELIHKGVKIFLEQDEALNKITEVVKLSKPKRRYATTLREVIEEGLKIVNKRYGIR